MKKRKFSNELNAGSMADIAFLLLIFFLVTTTIEVDRGIKVKLPRWEADQNFKKIPDRNVLSIHLNLKDELMVEDKKIEIADLKELTKAFISNPEKSEDKPTAPKNALVALKNNRETSYGKYILVYNELKAAYNDLWEEASQKQFGKTFASLSNVQKNKIKKQIPLVISESEPIAIN